MLFGVWTGRGGWRAGGWRSPPTPTTTTLNRRSTSATIRVWLILGFIIIGEIFCGFLKEVWFERCGEAELSDAVQLFHQL